MESQLSRLVVESVFPRFCVGCRREGSLWCEICDELQVQFFLSPSCPFCSRKGSNRTCQDCKSYTYLDGLTAMGPYAITKIKEAIKLWKYYQDRFIEPIIFKWLQQELSRMNLPIMPFYATHVPLHFKKERERGFDQARCVAEWTEKLFGIFVEDLLVRQVRTVSQARQETRKIGELDHIFEIHPDVVEVPENILLCDDVFTSGATMDAAARRLKESGAKMVWGFVVARK